MKHTFNGFPIDGSAGSQVKYDLFAEYMSKAINGVANAKSGNSTFLFLPLLLLQIVLIVVAVAVAFISYLVHTAYDGLMASHYRSERLRLEAEQKEKNRIKQIELDRIQAEEDALYDSLIPDEAKQEIAQEEKEANRPTRVILGKVEKVSEDYNDNIQINFGENE